MKNKLNIKIGPRHKKLDMAFLKAVDKTIKRFGVDEIKKVFPSFPHYEETLKMAHLEAISFFKEKSMEEWAKVTSKYDIYGKLHKLDEAIERMNEEKLDQTLGLLKYNVDLENGKEIERLDKEIETIEEENRSLALEITAV